MEQTIHHFLYVEKFIVSLVILRIISLFHLVPQTQLYSAFFFSKVQIEFKMKIMRPVFARIINKLIDCLIDYWQGIFQPWFFACCIG